jgi:hypothetical protein
MSKPYELHCRLSEADWQILELDCARKRVTKTEWVELHICEAAIDLCEERDRGRDTENLDLPG